MFSSESKSGTFSFVKNINLSNHNINEEMKRLLMEAEILKEERPAACDRVYKA